MIHIIINVVKVLLLLVVGLVLGVFSVFLVVFSDKHSQSDYVYGLMVVAAEFFVVAGVTALLMRSWRFPLWLLLPSILILIEYSQRETQQIPYHVAVFAALCVGSGLGVLLGLLLRSRGSRPTPVV